LPGRQRGKGAAEIAASAWRRPLEAQPAVAAPIMSTVAGPRGKTALQGQPALAQEWSAPEPPKRVALGILRMLLGALLVALLAGGATAVFARGEVEKLVETVGQKHIKIEPKVLAPTYEGGPQTLLLVGNDERRRTTTSPVVPHSNEMLLVRIDPSRPVVSMLSIPRELQVTFSAPNGEVITNRFNSAYTYGYEEGGGTKGGIKLMVETIKKTLGLGVNHVFVINFKKFEHAIEEIGCVYFPVDTRYYHKNEPGTEQYFEVNLQPGYQTLCGKQALEYVANRHESTSLVRDARDQRFMLEVKKEYGGSLFEEREKFEHIFGKNVETDLHGEGQIFELLKLLVQAQGKPVRQIHFNADLVPTSATNCACVLASPEQIQEAKRQFLGGTAPISESRIKDALSGAKQQARAKAKRSRRAPPPQPAMMPTSAEAIAHARSLAPYLPFALEYPRIRNITGEVEPERLRLYTLHGPGHRPYKSYVIAVNRAPLGEYYDIEGTTWLDPPILAKPSDTVKIGSREYSLYYSGEHITTVAWREGSAVYWVENTLINSVSPREMIEIAEETQPVDRVVSRAPLKRAKAAEAALRLPSASSSANSRDRRIAEVIGVVSLLALALLSVLVLRRWREVKLLREQLASQVAALEAHAKRQRALF
jgi:polyisoprenyl-teichoic acid--peptidoglycan teichoic acid transferase